MSKAIVTSRQYKNLFRPEDTSYLTGNAGDVIECELQYEVTIDSLSSFSNTYKISNGNRITRSTGSWFDEGFAENQTVSISFDIIVPVGVPPTPPTIITVHYSGNVKTLTPTIMILDNILQQPAATPATLVNLVAPFIANGYDISGMRMATTSSVQGIEFEYGLVTNTQTSSGNVTSIIDGTTTSFSHLNVNAASPTVLNLVPIGFESGSSILSATIKGLGIASNIQTFQINIKYIITPLWESITDVQTPTLPSFYKDKECIADVFNIKMLSQSGNPNVSVSTSSSEVKLLGNTGFFEENYNGKANNYSVDTYSLFTNGTPTTGIQTSGNTSFTLVILDPTNTSLSKYKMGFVWTPNDDTIFQSKGIYNHETLMYNGLDDSNALVPTNTPVTYNGTVNSTGAKMDIELTSLTRLGNYVTLQGVFKPNTDFTTYIDAQSEDDKNYLVWLSVGEESLATNISDRVSLIVDTSKFSRELLSYQSWNVSNSFLEHPQPASQVGVSNYAGCSEDEILARSIIKLDTSKNETIEEITFTIEGYNSVTQQGYILESNGYDTTVFVKDGAGVQQISIDERRGFLMAAGVDKNFVKVERSPIDDSGTLVGYRSFYAFRARWEDWIANSNVPSLFYNNTELNNDLNNNWATKDDIVNWDLTFTLKLKVLSLGEIINTQNRFIFSIKEYEESTVWDGAITLYNEAKTTSLYTGLNGDGIRQNVILPSEKTFIEADFDLENLTSDVGAISSYYGVIRMEEYRNGGLFKINMFSTSLANVMSGNLLLPLSGLTQTKITKISATKIRLECYIDNTQLNSSVSQYKISARIGCGNINAGKYNRQYSVKYD